jgi:tetratricopeptide (TPR) repeat protein
MSSSNGTQPVEKISLAMIVRNCAADLDRCLASIRQYVDDACIVDTEPGGSTDGTREVLKKYDCRILDFPWINDFSAARNFSFDQCLHDAVLWLDSDDVVENPHTLMQTAKSLMLSKVDAIFCRYDYEFDKAGHCTTRLWRERITDRNRFKWAAPIHECQLATYRYEAAYLKPEFGVIRHARKREDQVTAKARLARNLEILDHADSTGKMETRLRYYWANTLMGLGEYQKAAEQFQLYIQHSGVPEERYAAMVSLSEAHRLLGNQPQQAINAAMQGVMFRPDFASAYLHIAEAYLSQNAYREAELWAKECLKHKDGAENEMVYNPKAIEARPHVVLSIAYANQQRIDEAVKHLQIADAYYPEDEMVGDIKAQIEKIHAKQALLNSHHNLRTQLQREDHPNRIRALVENSPDLIKNEPLIQKQLVKQRTPGKPLVAFFCPVVGEAWNPHAIARGIGGSEEAVINMARELSSRGFEVEVYCEVDGPGEYPGFGHWYPFEAFGGDEDQFDCVIWWRNPESPIAAGMKSTLSYVWLHDTPVATQWIPNYGDMIDRVFFLSSFHRQLYPWVRDEHALVTQNGTDPALWKEPKNEPGKLIYSSCPSRGLKFLLRWWSYIKEKAPHASLDIFYGWNVWAQQSARLDPNFGADFRTIEQMKDQPGITWHGRVGQEELAEAFSRAQIWAYPMSFPEISCITAMKAQIHGCLPIVIDKRNAVAETVQHGEKLDLEIQDVIGQRVFMDTVIKHLKDPGLFTAEKKQAMVTWARGEYRWAKVADSWAEMIRSDLAMKVSQGRAFSVTRGRAPRRVRTVAPSIT